MSNFLILHGTDATPDSNWFMWLKGVLIGKGHKVWLPQLPNSDEPNTKTYNKFLLATKNFEFNSDTIIIGHSSGAVEILSLLQNLPKDTVVKGAVFVGAFKDNLKSDALNGLFIEPFDFKLIKAHCSNFQFIHSDDDPHVPIAHAEYLAEQTEGVLNIFEGQGHFSNEFSPDFKQFPDILEIIDEI